MLKVRVQQLFALFVVRLLPALGKDAGIIIDEMAGPFAGALPSFRCPRSVLWRRI